MQKSEKLSIVSAILCLCACAAIYANPTSKELVLSIDKQAFYLLNGSLESCVIWQTFCFYINHDMEKILNLVVFILVNIYIISKENGPEKMVMVWNLLLLFLFMQIAIMIKDGIFIKALSFKRHSPSMVLTPFISLAEIFDSKSVKTVSQSSFPGGHAFAAAFWAIYTCTFVRRKFWPLVWIIAIPVMIGRLFSGAHWLSDIIVSFILAWALVSIFVYTTANIKLASILRRTLKHKH